MIGPSLGAEPAAAGVLLFDAVGLDADDAAGPGPQGITVTHVDVEDEDDGLEIVLYQPEQLEPRAPAIVFLPGRMAPDDQYASYARVLASRGFVVAVRGWYAVFRTDAELAHDASRIARWLTQTQQIDATRIGIAGHSMVARMRCWPPPDMANLPASSPSIQTTMAMSRPSLAR